MRFEHKCSDILVIRSSVSDYHSTSALLLIMADLKRVHLFENTIFCIRPNSLRNCRFLLNVERSKVRTWPKEILGTRNGTLFCKKEQKNDDTCTGQMRAVRARVSVGKHLSVYWSF